MTAEQLARAISPACADRGRNVGPDDRLAVARAVLARAHRPMPAGLSPREAAALREVREAELVREAVASACAL